MLGRARVHSSKKFFSRKAQRGYLGPIGDDIPSLIPIIVGLLTFFAAFTFTLNSYNQRAQLFSADRDTLIIANTLKGDSYLATYAEFDTACKGLRVRGLNYAAGVVESAQWNQIMLESQENLSSGNGDPGLSFIVNHLYAVPNANTGNADTLECASGIDTPLSQAELSAVLQNNQYVILAFPVALEIPTAVVPATLVVITWRV